MHSQSVNQIFLIAFIAFIDFNRAKRFLPY